jgi:hypothetical protein
MGEFLFMGPDRSGAFSRRILLAIFLLALIGLAPASASQPSDIDTVAKASGEKGLTPLIAKWPTKESCTTPHSKYRLEPRWDSFASRGDLWVCFYRILSSLETRGEIRQWLSQFDMELAEGRGTNNQDILAFNCSKNNKKCRINWGTVDVVLQVLLRPYSFSFTIYERGGRIYNFYVSANRE